MKKLLKFLSKSLCLVLSLIMCVAVVGCDKGNEDTGSNAPVEFINTEDYVNNPEDMGLIQFGTHKYLVSETEDKWLVKNGLTDYKLVVQASTVESASTYYRYAINEMVYFFEMATNITLEVVIDTTLPLEDQAHNPNQHYISLDTTTLFSSTGITNTVDELQMYGGKIVTKDNNIYIVGNTDIGTLNAVYTFLDLTFNWEVYSANTIVIDKNVKDLKLYNYNVIDIPDVPYQPTSSYEHYSWGEAPDYGVKLYHATEDSRMYGTRVRAFPSSGLPAVEILKDNPDYIPTSTDPEQIAKNEAYIRKYADSNDPEGYALYNALSKPGGHNSVLLVPEEFWGHKSNWYGGVQLCYTAHGNEADLDEITSRFADMIKMQLIRMPAAIYPYSRSVDITITDDPGMCGCDECTRQKQVYKDSGLVVKYMNIIAEKVKKWMELPGNEPYRRDNLEIRHYAYLGTEDPPAKIDPETGEWVAIDETVMMHKNTCIKYANINTDFQQSIFAEDNAWARDIFDGWAAVSGGRIGYFMYNYNVKHNYFYDGFDHYDTKGINYYLAGGRSYYYSENIHGASPTEFGGLVSYLNAKLCYNSLLDSGKLMQKWFDACYGPASGIMMDLLNSIRAFNHNETVRNDLYKRFSIYNQVYFRFNWKPVVLKGWIAKADEAHAAIEYLKETNYDEWYRIAYNIELEAFDPILLMFKHNSSSMSAEEYNSYKARVLSNIATWPDYSMVHIVDSGYVKTWIQTI